MDEEEAERQRKVKAGREKLLHFRQKKSGVKKKKKSSGKSGQSAVQQSEGGGSKAATSPSEQDESALVDTDQDVSSIASEPEEKVPEPEQKIQVFAPSEEEINTESFGSESYTSGEESYTGTSEDGCVDDLVIANLERNELKNRTVELEEQLAAKMSALKNISKENVELKTQLSDVKIASSSLANSGDTEPNMDEKSSFLVKNETQSKASELQSENDKLRKMVDEYQALEIAESSHIEELKGKLKTKEEALAELSKQNEVLSLEVYSLKAQLGSPSEDVAQLNEVLKIKEDALQQLKTEIEEQRMLSRSLEESLGESKVQLSEYAKALQGKDRELSQLQAGYRAYYDNVQANMTQVNEQLLKKNQEMQMICHDRDQRLGQASQEITRLRQMMSEKEGQNNKAPSEEYSTKMAEMALQLAESGYALETAQNQLRQVTYQHKQSEEELVLVKRHLQDQVEQNLSSQEQHSSTEQQFKEKEEKISMLEQQLSSLSQLHQELSQGSETVGQQMIELQDVLNDRNEKISQLEISLSEVDEERNVMKNEMQKQSHELLGQMSELHDQLNESNTKLKEQSDDMDNSFSELQFTQEMVKELQKSMLEKDLSVDNLNQKLHNAELEHNETFEAFQAKIVQEKELWKSKFEEKEILSRNLDISLVDMEQHLSREKASGVELRATIDNMNVEVEQHRNRANDLSKDLATKEEALNDLRERFAIATKQHGDEVESLKLELEKVRETTPESDQIISEMSEKYEEELAELRQVLDENESRVHQLVSKVQERDQRLGNLEGEVKEKLAQVESLEDQVREAVRERDEAIASNRVSMEQERDLVESKKENLATELSNVRGQYENKMASLKSQHSLEWDELNAKVEELETSRSFTETELTKVTENYETEMRSLYTVNKELENKVKELERLLSDTAVNEGFKLQDLKEQLELQKTEYEKVIQQAETLSVERDELQSELSSKGVIINERDSLLVASESKMTLLSDEIRTLEDELHQSQSNLAEQLREKERYEELYGSSASTNTDEMLLLREEFRLKEDQHKSDVMALENEVKGWLEKYDIAENELCKIKEELGQRDEELRETQHKLREVENDLREKSEELREKDEEVRVREDELRENKDKLLENEEKLREVENDLRGKSDELRETDEQLREKENELTLREKDDDLCEKDDDLREIQEKLRQKCQELNSRNDELGTELREKDDELREKQEKCRAHEEELRTKRDEHVQEIMEMDNQLEHTRKAIESMKLENESKVAELKETLNRTQEEYEKKLELQDQVHKNEVENMNEMLNHTTEEYERKLEIQDQEHTSKVENITETLNRVKTDNESKVAELNESLNHTQEEYEKLELQSEEHQNGVENIKETLNRTREEYERKLEMRDEEHQTRLVEIQKMNEELKRDLEKEKGYSANMTEEVQALVSEKEAVALRVRELENLDWTASNIVGEKHVVVENIVGSENVMESQAVGDDPSLFADEQITAAREDNTQLSMHKAGVPKTKDDVKSGDYLQLLQQVSTLQEKLAEKEKSELGLIEEKNKLLKIVKEYNESLANERDCLKEKIIDQDQTIQDLQDQLCTSELVSADLQEVFGRQLFTLQGQRDSLIGQLEEQQKERSSFVDILEEKHALEENLRSEKEHLADKLRQKDLLESQLEQERAALQDQLIRQAKLNEIIKEKDALEEELVDQKNKLQVELSTIERSLVEKERLLERERETLQSQLVEKDHELHTWEGEYRSREAAMVEERERIENSYRDTLLATRTELEDTYEQSLTHLRTELDEGYRERLLQMEGDFQIHHDEEIGRLARQHEQQVTGLKSEYEEKIANLKGILEEQRRKQVFTMKNVLERNRDDEVEQMKGDHESDMDELRKELNIRHQDIVTALVDRLKKTHDQEMEDCLASAITDNVLKVEVARLEVEQEYESKLKKLHRESEVEIENLKQKHEEEKRELGEFYQKQIDEAQKLDNENASETELLRERCQRLLEKLNELEKRNIDLVKELTAKHEEDMKTKLAEAREEMRREHEVELETVRVEIEMQYDDQMENLQDELELKYENSLRELREELERQSQVITTSAVEELQEKHDAEVNVLKSEHEHEHEQMSNVREKLEAGYKEEICELEDRLNERSEKLKEMESRLEKMIEESKRNESERMETLRSAMEQKMAFLEQEHGSEITEITRKTEKAMSDKDRAFNEDAQKIKEAFEKEKMDIELKHMSELNGIASDTDKRIFEKDQEHVSEINHLQQKLILLKEEGEEARFREADESRKQLTEKYQKDLDAIVQELKLQHKKQIETLISEAESNQVDHERVEFEKWKMSIVEKHEKETRELRNEHQKELDKTRRMLNDERVEEVTKITTALSTKHDKEMEELRTKMSREHEEELDKVMKENQSRYEKKVATLSKEIEMLKAQHEEALRALEEKLTGVFTEKLEEGWRELRIYKDLAQEKELEIESLKREHHKEVKDLKHGHFDDILEEVSQVRSDLALDLAREIELIKMENEYQLAKKVKELQESHDNEIVGYVAKVSSLEQEKESLNDVLRRHAEEILELKRQLENEKNELGQVHREAVEDLQAKLEAQQQDSLNELKLRLMSDMEEMQEVYKKMEEDFIERESKLKEDIEAQEETLEKLKQDHEEKLIQLSELMNREKQHSLDELGEAHRQKIYDIEEKHAVELRSQKDSLEKEKEDVLTALKQELSRSMNEKHEEQLKLLSEQHSKELELLRDELVKTHMEKFTLMTEQLEEAHQEELAQVRKSVQEKANEEIQTKIQKAEEFVRYTMEQEQLENLRKLEEDLLSKHQGQVAALNGLLKHHQAELDKMKDEHEVEKQNVINEWKRKLSDALSTVKSVHEQEIVSKDEQLVKAEAELKRYVLEIETKDQNMNALTESIAEANMEYEQRLAEMRKEFDSKLEEVKSSVNGSTETQIRAIQELLSKQHKEELERLKEEHEKQTTLLSNELGGARALTKQIEEESNQKLLEQKTKAEEQEKLLNEKLDNMKVVIANTEQEVNELKEKSEDIQKQFDEKQNEYNQVIEKKDAALLQCRSLEETVREMMNRHEREQQEDANMVKMLNADLDALNLERDGIQRAKEHLLRQLSTVVRATMITEETINSRLEALLEQTQDGEASMFDVNSISEESLQEAFRRRHGAPTLATSTPAAGPAAAALDNDDDDDDDDERTLKEGDVSLASDEGLELSAVLSDAAMQGSFDLQNEEAILDSGNRLRVAVQKILDMVASVTQQLQNARTTQDELFNTTSQRTAELNQLSEAQVLLMARLEEEIESKDDLTNKLRKAEEDMEMYVAEIDRLENLHEENEEVKETDKIDDRKQEKIDVLENEKDELLKKVESLKNKSEDMEKNYEREKQELCEIINDLQQKVDKLGSDASKNKDFENKQLELLQNQVATLEEQNNNFQNQLCDNDEEMIRKQEQYEDEINRVKIAALEAQVLLRTDNGGLVRRNDSLTEEVNALNAAVDGLEGEKQQVSEEKVLLQKTCEEQELAWENERNNLQQQLYDSYLETSSLKEKLKLKGGDEGENVAELEEKISEQTEAFDKLKEEADTLESVIGNLKKSLSAKEEEVRVLGQNFEEIQESLISQQNVLDEQRELLSHAENTRTTDQENIRNLKDALSEATKKVEEGDVKMQELLNNMKNVEDTYKMETAHVTELLNKKVEELEKELSETKTNLEQQQSQSQYSFASHISELKQQHNEEIQVLRHQFETDIQNAIERTKLDAQDSRGEPREELDYSTHRAGSISDHDTSTGARLDIELLSVDHFTNAISQYLSDLPEHHMFDQKDVHDSSTHEMLNSILDDVKADADAIYGLVNHIPAFYDPNIKSVQLAWREEKEILQQAIQHLETIVVQKPEELSGENDWRTTILSSVLDILTEEEQMLSSELQAMELLTRSDAMAISKLVKRRQEKQEELHRHSVEKLYQTDRNALLNQLTELQASLTTVKKELTEENKRLQAQLKHIQEQVQKRENEFLQQVASKEKLVQQERDVNNELRAEQETDKTRLQEADDLIQRERALVKDLQNVLNNSKTRMKTLESAVQREKTQTAVIQTCLDSERARCVNLEEALQRERQNVEQRERELEQKSKLLLDLSGEEQENIEKLKEAVLDGKQQVVEYEAQLEQERTKNTQLRTELKSQNKRAADQEKQSEVISKLQQDLQQEKSRNAALTKTLNEEQRMSEELKSSLGSIHGVNEQISDQEQLITELSQALEKERMVNEELRNAFDKEYESFEQIEDNRQLHVVKGLQTSLSAVQDQLQNQIEVVEQERTRAIRLRKERDIHEATALGARNKEAQLEKELGLEKASRELEVRNLKDVIERKISEKKDLEENMKDRNTEFEVLCKELQRIKGASTSESKVANPTRDGLNMLHHDLKSLFDEHRVLLILHKDYLNQQSKRHLDSDHETSTLRTNVETLLSEIDRMKMLLGTIPEGTSSIPLSPIKAAAYDRVTKQNKELSDFIVKLTKEKDEFRSTLRRLEHEVADYHDREVSYENNARHNKQELETLFKVEKSRFTQERLSMNQILEERKKTIMGLEEKLRDKDNELDEARNKLLGTRDELQTAIAKRSEPTENACGRWTMPKIQKLYVRYMRAEKARKSLAYQKRYLVLMLGGFRESESITLSLIAKMGAYPSFQQPPTRFSPAFSRFRTAVRVVIATKRMALLVRKSKLSLRQVAESSNRDDHRHKTGKHTNATYKPDYVPQTSFNPHGSSLSYPVTKGPSSNISVDSNGNITLSPVHHEDTFTNHFRADYHTSQPADTSMSGGSTPTDGSRYYGITTRDNNNFVPTNQTTSHFLSRPSPAVSASYSPPVKEVTSRYMHTRPSPRPSMTSSLHGYRSHTETSSVNDVDLQQDSPDLDSKIRTLDNLQQKLSAARGTGDRSRRF